jgi:hypothetical protein
LSVNAWSDITQFVQARRVPVFRTRWSCCARRRPRRGRASRGAHGGSNEGKVTAFGATPPLTVGSASARPPPDLPFKFVVANGRCGSASGRWSDLSPMEGHRRGQPVPLFRDGPPRAVADEIHMHLSPSASIKGALAAVLSGSRCMKFARWSRRCRRRRAASHPSRPRARRAGPKPRHDARPRPRSRSRNSHSSLPAGHP